MSEHPYNKAYRGAFADAHPDVLRLEARILELGGDLPGDLDPVHCTTCAWFLKEELGETTIQGFLYDDNPSAASAYLAGGHDFALYRGRFILDPWAVDTIGVADGGAYKYVHDLEDPRDADEIARLYGDRSRWVEHEGDFQLRRYECMEDDEIIDLAIEGRAGAIDEAENRGLNIRRYRKPAIR